MEWFHAFGLVVVMLLMIPNVLFAIKCKEGFENKWNHKVIEWTEQIGRIGCFSLMIFDIPGTCFQGWADTGLEIPVSLLLVFLYEVIWIVCWRKNSVFKALALSILPSVLFLFSGIVRGSVLLVIAAAVFGPTHILISYKNAKA